MESTKIPLSVSIISFNEEKNIARTLASVVDFASEIIVVDSHSTDRTVEIAQEYNAKIYIEDWKGFGAQKNSALEKCSFDWILCLDCDEVVTPELQRSIIEAVNTGNHSAYVFNRRTFYLGKLMKYSWQPDWNLRLVNKNAHPRWDNVDVHESIIIDASIGKLNGFMLHYSYQDIKHHLNKAIVYARISADSYIKKGRGFSILNLLANPLLAFMKMYFIHLGILDGVRGFIAAVSSAFGTFLKFAFIFEKKNKE